MQEIWKPIKGYEGLYEVSNTGKIKSIANGKNRVLIPTGVRGYDSIGLCKRPGGKKSFLVHRLVAEAFVPNPNGYTEVNHKDECKTNNNADNLEWCTRSYNMAYGSARVRQGVSYGRPVYQMTLFGVRVAAYCSAEIAGKITGIDCSSIHKCCRNKRESAGGYKWAYSTEKLF